MGAFQSKTDIYAILELASKFSEDDFGNHVYVFESPVGTVILSYCINDGDTSVELFVKGQDSPIVKIDIQGCMEIIVVNDKRGKYLEFSGRLCIESHISRGQQVKTTGFRLQIEPFLLVEPFIKEEQHINV